MKVTEQTYSHIDNVDLDIQTQMRGAPSGLPQLLALHKIHVQLNMFINLILAVIMRHMCPLQFTMNKHVHMLTVVTPGTVIHA